MGSSIKQKNDVIQEKGEKLQNTIMSGLCNNHEGDFDTASLEDETYAEVLNV